MKKIIITPSLILLGFINATAHPNHNDPHIHITKTLSIGFIALVSIAIAVTLLFLTRKQLKKRKNYAK